jgi:2-polyprenyl-3-methyl-5-hydroxy-6-metoxy-1,4-benzoquinol methylase
MFNWDNVNEWERSWWGSCQNTFGEEEKQLLYLNRMGFISFYNNKSSYNFNLNGETVLDIGGGPASFLLKCVNFKGTVVDPCNYPKWVVDRYKLADIEYIKQKGEDLDVSKQYDLVTIYNVLLHTEDPYKIIKNALHVSKIIKIFEWINTEPSDGHPQTFTENQLDEWLGGIGKTEEFNGENSWQGTGYFGIFKGERFE